MGDQREQTIPILPCPSVPDLVDFYATLGFETTHLQTRPNPFASLRYGAEGDGFELQFFGHKSVVPEESWSTCYVLTERVDELYAAFRAGLKRAYGRVPTRGIPRLGQLKDTSYGVRQFLLTDPGGNCVRIGQPNGESMDHAPMPKEKFARALRQAWLLGVSRGAKGDAAQGARILDHALATATPASAAERLKALVLRADLACTLDDPALAASLLAEVRKAEDGLGAAERTALSDDLIRAADLRDTLREAAQDG
ncbi:bleomycin resistance protein [Streptomyces sp. NPDC054796]